MRSHDGAWTLVAVVACALMCVVPAARADDQARGSVQATGQSVDTGASGLALASFLRPSAHDLAGMARYGIDRVRLALPARGPNTSLVQDRIDAYQASNMSVGTRVKCLSVGAAKWTAVSAGIALASNVTSELSRHDWDPRAVEWKKTASFLAQKEFWGGTAGSFFGSVVGTALTSLVPAAALAQPVLQVAIPAFLGIGGAALGWQVGSGQTAATDWTALLVNTLGATAGFTAGTFLCGPVGAAVGAMLGQALSQWLLDKARGGKTAKSEPTVTTRGETYVPQGRASGAGQAADDSDDPFAEVKKTGF